MKKLSFILVGFVIAISLFSSLQASSQNGASLVVVAQTDPTATAIVKVDRLNLRSGPGRQYAPLGVVLAGEALTVIGQESNCAWLQVKTSAGTMGWVSGAVQYVTLSLPCESIGSSLIVTPTPTDAPVKPESTADEAIVQGQIVNLRSGPGTDNSILGIVRKGDSLTVIERSTDCSWVQVKTLQGVVGWVPGDAQSVALSPPCGNATLTPTPTSPISRTVVPVAEEWATMADVQARVLNVRSGPGIEYAVVEVVRRGDKLDVIGHYNHCSWLQVKTPKANTGWVAGSSQYVSLVQPCGGDDSTPTPVSTLAPNASAPITPISGCDPLPPTGMIQRYIPENGLGEMSIQNDQGSEDGIIVLTSSKEESLISAFIRKGEIYNLTGIPDGDYLLFFSKGQCWNNNTKGFTQNAVYQKFPDMFTFKTSATQYSIWNVTIYSVPDINGVPPQNVDPKRFPKR